jgi:hypothetical protein
MIDVDVVISINVYKNIPFLQKQLINIEEHVSFSYSVILNCNDYMFGELQDIHFPENIHVHPIPINKQTFTGKVNEGIISNMEYALKKIKFKYFLILSSRTFFYKRLYLDNLNALHENKKWKNLDEMNMNRIGKFDNADVLILENLFIIDNKNKHSVNSKIISELKHNDYLNNNPNLWYPNGWFWRSFIQTKLSQHYLNSKYKLECSYHEGLCFTFNVTKNIINFLEKNLEIRIDLMNTSHCCVEEFSLQTISCNEVNPDNLEYGFSFIGQGNRPIQYYDYTGKNMYVHKLNFDK